MNRVVYRDFGMKRIFTAVQRAGLERLRVGVVGPKASEMSDSSGGRLTNEQVARINYYGTDDGHIPPRRFLLEPFQNGRRKVTSIFRAGTQRLLGESADLAMDWIGKQLAAMVRTAVEKEPGVAPPNAPATILKKGFDHPLMWLGHLAEAISHRIVRGSGDVVEAGAAIGDYERFEVGGE